MVQYSTGTTMPSLNDGIIERIPIVLPPIGEQRTIAGILGALDDKVELNQLTSQTLEGMAQALCRSWFVDFEPVIARAGGHDSYGLAGEDLALFPNRLVDSDLGPIPDGWGIDSIGQQLELCREGVVPWQFPSEMFAHYSIPAFDEAKAPRLELGATIKSNKFAVPRDAVLLSKLNPEIARVWLPDCDSSHRSVCSTEFLVCQAREPASREYLYCLFLDPDFRSEFSGRVTGTSKSHQRVRPDDLISIKVVVPSAAIIRLFTRRVHDWFLRAESARRESLILTALRDALLPRLLSGKLRVGKTDKFLEQAV
jgi:type I restriction enzyme S subunit